MENRDKELEETKVTAFADTEIKKPGKFYVPLVDIYENKDHFMLVADLPGVDDKSIDVTVEKNVLTIHGTVEPVLYKDHELSCMEYDIGDFRRSFLLSGDIDKDKISATVKDGVLHLMLPKTEEVKVKKITVH